jgi:hypothetical protein
MKNGTVPNAIISRCSVKLGIVCPMANEGD